MATVGWFSSSVRARVPALELAIVNPKGHVTEGGASLEGFFGSCCVFDLHKGDKSTGSFVEQLHCFDFSKHRKGFDDVIGLHFTGDISKPEDSVGWI